MDGWLYLSLSRILFRSLPMTLTRVAHHPTPQQQTMSKRPVIAVAGLACETSTFTPSRTSAPAFHPQRGDEIAKYYTFLHDDKPLAKDATWKGALIGHALPGVW